MDFFVIQFFFIAWIFARLAGSTASLVSGTVFGLAAGFGSYQVSNNPKNVVFALGNEIALLVECQPVGLYT